LAANYGTGKTIFVENCSDLFADGIDAHWIGAILSHCRHAPENTYVIQTKNPSRVREFVFLFPPRFLIGTTAESDNHYVMMSKATAPALRMFYLSDLAIPRENKFLTIEPIMSFDAGIFIGMILGADVGKIYIGSDSKNHGLPEPTGEEIGELIRALRDAGQTVILKSNLKRLYEGE
jgi:protein gp37